VTAARHAVSDGVAVLAGVRVMVCPDDGPLIDAESRATDLIGDAFGLDVAAVAVPAIRLPPAFFQLRTGLAGAVTQKFANYGFLLAVVGDVSRWTAASGALADFVREADRGRVVWFVADMERLAERLLARPPTR